MAVDHFHFVPHIRSATKYFDISIEEIERQLASGQNRCKCESMFDLEPFGAAGREVALRLHVACPNGALAWRAALIMHDIRIDGVDWEAGTGWHRHGWDSLETSAENGKDAVAGFDSVKSRRDFLLRVVSEMRLVLNALDNGDQSKLQFD